MQTHEAVNNTVQYENLNTDEVLLNTPAWVDTFASFVASLKAKPTVFGFPQSKPGWGPGASPGLSETPAGTGLRGFLETN
jgi:hypothetical protein